MGYHVEITKRAQSDINHFARYCRKYSQRFWEAQEARLIHVFGSWLPATAYTWNFFFATGAPYRAYLFEVGERTKYWIVYSIEEETKTIVVLRLWNAARNPRRFRT